MRWTAKKSFSKLSGELAASDDRVFERKVVSFLRTVYRDAVDAPARRSLDRAGVDCVVFSDSAPFPLAVQCKGWQVQDWEIGQDQVNQCVESVESFRKSGLTCERYLLVHNRDDRKSLVRAALAATLKRLVDDGIAREAQVLSRKEFLSFVLDRAHEHVVAQITNLTEQTLQALQDRNTQLELLREVACRSRQLVASPYGLERAKLLSEGCFDPAEYVLNRAERRFLILGEAGYGKTTTLVRTAMKTGGPVLFAQASRFGPDTNSTKALVLQLVDEDSLLEGVDDEDREAALSLFRIALEGFVLHPDNEHLTVFIDGLDESVFLSRRGGIQFLMNAVRQLPGRVFLSARTEYWSQRFADFSDSYGVRGEGPPPTQRIIELELLPWSDELIAEVASNYARAADEPIRSRVYQFRDLVVGGGYTEYYGDIPRRPLFLGMILDTVAEHGLVHQSRAALFGEWLLQKISRDWTAPISDGGAGRLGIADGVEARRDSLELSWRAMTLAAAAMTKFEDGQLLLLPSCVLTKAFSAEPRLAAMRDHLGLYMHSVLVPSPGAPGEASRARFAHRLFQEYFTARAYLDGLFKGHHSLPAEISSWVQELDELQRGKQG